MKKLIYLMLITALLSVSACTDSDTPNLPTEKTVYSTIISPEEAVAIANAVGNATPNRSRSDVRRASVTDLVPLGNPSSRSGKADTLIYAVNYADEQGFTLIAATPVEEPVLAVIDNGSYDEEELSKVPGFDSFMNKAREYTASTYALIDTTHKFIEPSYPVEIDTIERQTMLPKLGAMAWGQHGVEADYCPNYASGCFPTAAGMMITYFKPSQKITYTFPNREIDSEYPDWDAMALHTNEPWHYCPTNVHKSIGHLCREIGHYSNSDYSIPFNTGTFSYAIPSVFYRFLPGYSVLPFREYTSSDNIRASINLGLVLMGGTDSKGDYSDHAWIADGYDKYRIRYTTTKLYFNYPYEEKIIEYRTVDLVHFNLGWGGSANGYYSGNVFSFRDEKNKVIAKYDTNQYMCVYKSK